MPIYFYNARSKFGEPKSGTIEARDIHELTRILHQQGYFLVLANLEQEVKKKSFEFSIPFLDRVSLKEKMFFTRNLRVMIGAGVSLPRALKTLAEQTKSVKFKKALLRIREEIIKGNNFSQGLDLYPNIFSELFRNMVKAGEESGTLEEVLKVLNEQMERENELKSKILGALIYPAVILCAMAGIGAIMLIFVIPKLAETFLEFNVEIPATTKFVIFLGNFLAQKWYLAILILLAAIFFLKVILETKIGKIIINGLFLKFPIISDIVKKTNSAYTARTLSSLIAAGVPIVKSLEIVSNALSNIYFKKALLQASQEVKKGKKLYEALKPYQGLYPLTVLQMVEIGEETGETVTVLSKLASFYEDEVASATKNLSSVVEPILMLVIGAAVGFFAISMIQPMYSMLQGLQQ